MSEQKLAYDKNMNDEQKAALAMAMLDVPTSMIEELPDFVQLPKGVFFADEVVSCEVKVDAESGSPIISLVLKVGETVELAAFPGVAPSDIPEENQVAPGGLYSARWQGALGIQKFCKQFKSVIEQMPEGTSVVQVIEALSLGQVTGLMFENTRRADKEKKEPNAVGELVPVTYNELVRVIQA